MRPASTVRPASLFSTAVTLLFAVGFDHLLIRRHRRLHSQLQEVAGTAAEELGDSEARYRALVDSSPLGVIACNRDGYVIAANPTILEILGTSGAKTLAGLNLFKHPQGVELGIGSALRSCLEAGEPYSREVNVLSKADKHTAFRSGSCRIQPARFAAA